MWHSVFGNARQCFTHERRLNSLKLCIIVINSTLTAEKGMTVTKVAVIIFKTIGCVTIGCNGNPGAPTPGDNRIGGMFHVLSQDRQIADLSSTDSGGLLVLNLHNSLTSTVQIE